LLTSDDHVIVVGAGLAGWRLVEALRAEGYAGKISLVGAEESAPYDRPPLSKQVLAGKWPIEQILLATQEKIATARIDTYFGNKAVALDAENKRVTLKSGKVLVGTRVAIATGVGARELPFTGAGAMYVLRTKEDTQELLEAIERLEEDDQVVIIGAGFIGAEVATTLHARGIKVVVLEAASRPLQGPLGETVATWLEDLPKEFGVEVRTNQKILDISEDGEEVFLEGESIRAAMVIGAVGSALDLTWLEESEIQLDGGVVVDEHFEAQPGIGAIGDVAKFPLRVASSVEMARIEHWQLAAEQAIVLAKYWVSEITAEPLIPYFWSDQYGKKIQMLGYPSPKDSVHLFKGSLASRSWAALYSRNELITGVIALNQPRALMLSKEFLSKPTAVGEALSKEF
jgi:NADPH-dependent 2,4-dienoyl-CoA reductase/sulfur reductase-like enzyme